MGTDIQSVEDNYKRDSFEDRVCDDLTEVILQYLSLEDKLRLECVSKQFQRTVYKELSNRIDIRLSVKHFSRMELLFKKCPNIQFGVYYNLKQSLDDINGLNENNYFIDKIFPKLTSLRITNSYESKIIEYFPNVEVLGLYLYPIENDFCSQIKFKNLKNLNIFIWDQDTNVASFAQLLDRHKSTLQSLFVSFHRPPEFDTELDTLLSYISNLNQLTYLGLKINARIDFNDKKVEEVVKRLPRLKILRLNSYLKRFSSAKNQICYSSLDFRKCPYNHATLH